MVQIYSSQANFNIHKTWQQLQDNVWEHENYYQFMKYEFGKQRLIQAEYFKDRIVQRCFCDYSLIPIFTSKLIYDNSASQVGKGIDFAINRCIEHLRRHIRQYGSEGYILQYDFHHYFANIPKENAHKILRQFYKDVKIRKVAFSMIDKFEEGLGLGSQLSQTFALYYPNRLDHKIKEYYKIKGYGRYMDDGYAISHSKEQLQEVLIYLREWCILNNIPINEDKTQITKLSKGFTFLKKRFIITKTNKIICKIDKKSIYRMKHKLRTLMIKYKLPLEYIDNIVKSWINSHKKYNCYKQIQNLKQYLKKLKEVRKQMERYNDSFRAN